VVLGTASYTLAQAQAATIPALPPSISACAILVGKIIVQKNATTATEISSAFAASYSAASLSNHADLLNLDYANSGHTGFQPTLVSGTSIKTVNNTSLLGSGNILAGHTIKDEGSVLTARTNLNFVGSTVTVTDDSSNDATVVTISIPDGDKGDITVSGSGTVWTVDTISPDKGGTGVANSANNTITFTGNYPLGITLASPTSIALPATGTLATLAGTETLTNKTLTSPTFTGTPTAPTAATGTSTTQIANTAFVVGEKGGRRNYLINGNFDKWDYATSQTTTGYGSDNRWSNDNSGSTKTHSQIACGDAERALFNAMFFSRTVVSSVAGANNLAVKYQKIENVNLLAGKTVTLSFWAKADANKNIAIEFAQVFGSGGSPSANVAGIGSQLVALTTTWQKKTITLTIPSTVGKTLGTDGVQTTYTDFFFWLDAGSTYATRTANLGQQSGTFDIAQVKIEDGSVATNGWHPYDGEFGGEVQACARYYEICESTSGGSGTAGINEQLYGVFKSEKRVAPSITESSVIEISNVGARTFNTVSTYGYKCYFPVQNTGAFYFSQRAVASAEL
jgi:hypothetical protein